MNSTITIGAPPNEKIQRFCGIETQKYPQTFRPTDHGHRLNTMEKYAESAQTELKEVQEILYQIRFELQQNSLF